MHRKLIIFLLAVGFALVAAEDGIPLWSFANFGADVIVYVNTRQAQKSMEPTLWKNIQTDKNAAIDKNKDDRLFNTKNRDIELVANIYIRSMQPMACFIEGMGEVTGNIFGDMQRLNGLLKGEGLPMLKEGKMGDFQTFGYQFPKTEDMTNMDFQVTALQEQRFQFRTNVGGSGKLPVGMMAPAGKVHPSLATLRNQDLSFCLLCRPERFKGIQAGDNEKLHSLLDFLDKLVYLSVTGRVEGKNLNVEALLTFKDVNEAFAMSAKIKEAFPELEKLLGNVSPPKILVNANILKLNVAFDIGMGWGLVKRYTNK